VPEVSFFREAYPRPQPRKGWWQSLYRGLQGSWVHTSISIDQGESIHLEQSTPLSLDLESGDHEIRATADRFDDGVLNVDVREGRPSIVAIAARTTLGEVATGNIGALELRRVSDPTELQPYAWYASRFFSVGGGSVAKSATISMIGCAVIAIGCVGAFLFGITTLWTRGPFTAVFTTGCVLFISSLLLPAVVSGVFVGIRFLRLPLAWRSPKRP